MGPETVSSMALQLGDYAVIGGMFTAFAGVFITVMHSNLKAITRRVEAVECRVSKVERDKTEKHDWAREAAVTRDKMEAINVGIARMDAKMDQNYGVAASVNRLTDALVEQRKANHAGG